MSPGGGAWPTRVLFGVPVAAVTMARALDEVDRAIAEGHRLRIGVVNAAKIVTMRRDATLRRDVLSSDLILADGMSVVWASRLLGQPLPERVTGLDLMLGMLERGSRRAWRVYCLGATEEVLDRAIARIRADHPGVVLAGRHHGYFPPEEEPAIARAIQAARPDILLVGMTSPRKERFLARWGSDLDIPVCHGVGGSFDVLAGKVRRAPRAWQRAGLEWLYRVLQEPRRLWRRYLVTNTLFCLLLLREFALRQPPVPMTRAQACAEAQSLAADFMEKHGGRINVLEAGCGSLANFRLGNAAHIVGIDVSAAALARNAVLHERIQADLHTYDLGDSEYDLIVCWNVLEHLAEPARVLRSFFRAVRPGGLLLLAFPNIFSLKALVAKCSPLPTHRLLHRLAHGQKAGTVPGYEICPTYLRSSIAPRSILTLAVRHGLDMQSLSYYESGMQLKLRQRLALVGWPWKFLDLIVRSLSLGLISLAATDCVLALRRPGVSASPSRPSTTSAIPDSRPIASSATSSIHR